MAEQPGVEYQLGQLTGQVAALVAQIAAMQMSISGMDERLRANERDTTRLMVKMSIIAIVSGGVGSLGVTLFSKFVTI